MYRLILCVVATLLAALHTRAQAIGDSIIKVESQPPVILLPDNVSIHFISPEPIRYVDISTKEIEGNLPVKNVLRIRHNTDSIKTGAAKTSVVTIIGEKFIAQYRIVLRPDLDPASAKANIEIAPADTRPLDIADVSLSETELKRISYHLLSKKPESKVCGTEAFGIKATVNRISTVGDYLFLDLSFKNSTELSYEIDQLRFSVDDKKITKATNAQSIPLTPVFVFEKREGFSKDYRNVFVFKKITFPGNKVLTIEMNEKQVSGRVLTMQLKYKEILKADSVPGY